MDRRRLHARVRRPADARRRARRPLRPPPSAPGRPGPLRRRLCDRRPGGQRQRADRRAGRDGRRRRAGDARDPVDPDRRVHQPGRARQGDRHLVGRLRARCRRRPDTRRAAARALLLELDLPDQHPRRRRRPDRRPAAGPRITRPEAPADRPHRRDPVRRRPVRTHLHPDPGAVERLDLAQHDPDRRSWPPACSSSS